MAAHMKNIRIPVLIALACSVAISSCAWAQAKTDADLLVQEAL
jgi:hypothetical protein